MVLVLGSFCSGPVVLRVFCTAAFGKCVCKYNAQNIIASQLAVTVGVLVASQVDMVMAFVCLKDLGTAICELLNRARAISQYSRGKFK